MAKRAYGIGPRTMRVTKEGLESLMLNAVRGDSKAEVLHSLTQFEALVKSMIKTERAEIKTEFDRQVD